MQYIENQIEARIPTLIKRHKTTYKNTETLRKAFVRDYSRKKIHSMNLDDYVIGKGSSYRTFCYRIECETDSMGRIKGAQASKFGVYYGRTKNDSNKIYRCSNVWGGNHGTGFNKIKESIINLLIAADNNDINAIIENRISPMLKGKILFIYHPNQYAPVYAETHLRHFIAELNIPDSFRSNAEMQCAIMKYRQGIPSLMAQPVYLWMTLLYDLFGYPDQNKSPAMSSRMPLLTDAVRSVEVIDGLPPINSTDTTTARIEGKGLWNADADRKKRIGNRGEAIVLEYERQRLCSAGKEKLAEQINHIAQTNDSAGYDILSYDNDGTERSIEVKATSASNINQGFFISANELEKSESLQNYHLYIVTSATTKNPKIYRIPKPNFHSNSFNLSPIAFKVTLK